MIAAKEFSGTGFPAGMASAQQKRYHKKGRKKSGAITPQMKGFIKIK